MKKTATPKESAPATGAKDEIRAVPVMPRGLPKADMRPNAHKVLAKRYLMKDNAGVPTESPEEMFWRVAYVIASEDAKYGASETEVMAVAREFYLLMTQRLFEPNSPTLMNAGRPLGQLSACFVLPVEDCLTNGQNGIYDTLRSMAVVHQSGGGTGFGFSRLRPSDDIVRSTMGVASGPISFMKLYDASTEVVKQGGTRRGANMGILRVDHPNIMDFICCKEDVTQITNFNISVAVTDAFMEAVKKGTNYDLRHPRTKEKCGEIDARTVFDAIVRHAWGTGEPGVFFVDKANRYNPVPHLGSYEATNPCGEQPLLPYDVCNLGSVNCGMFVKDAVPAKAPWREKIDWQEFSRVIHLAIHFLDNVIDANSFPLPEIADLARRIRRIGLGPMGWADLLLRAGIGYNTEEGVQAAREVAAFMDEEAKKASEALAAVRGTFPEWGKSIWGPDATCARDEKGSRIRPMRKLRNCNVNTVAPTGTISIFANCTGGIEPLFAVAFMRNQAGSLMPDVNEDFIRVAKQQGWYTDALMEKVAAAGSLHFDEVPEAVQKVFVSAHDVTPEWHVRMQAAWQEFTDSAISKTCNFPTEATEADVREIYLKAYDLNCKGVTVYRDKCRPAQVLSAGTAAPQPAMSAGPAAPSQELLAAEAKIESLLRQVDDLKDQVAESHAKRNVRSRPSSLRGSTRRIVTPLGDLYVTINEDETGKPFEVFATLGKAGGAAMADVEALGRLISLALRSNIPLQTVERQLRGISCDRAIGIGPRKVLSVPDAIGQVFMMYREEREGIQQDLLAPVAQPSAVQQPAFEYASTGADADTSFAGQCPECHAELTMVEGCVKCMHCQTYSECG